MRHLLLLNILLACAFFMVGTQPSTAQQVLVHPGLSHKSSDLDRMKYMVKAGREPWKTSFQNFSQNPYASYNYAVQGDPSVTKIVLPSTLPGYNYEKFKFDALAAYYNALMWKITDDERHAQKCVQIFNAWVNVTHFTSSGTRPLDAGRVIWKMLEGAEIIKSTYAGWSESDLNKFKAMLVYPGYSTTVEPTAAIDSEDATFYWYMYNGDSGRHGNQGLFAMRGIMAMGVFLDNEVMYDRALRYLKGMPHRADDLPYPSGPRIVSAEPTASSNAYYDEFSPIPPYFENTTPDYGFNEFIGHYIWENGQCQESSRDQGHSVSGVAIINSMCEMAWNQGDDLYSFLDYRPLLGIEFGQRYNMSLNYSFPDQPSPWEPTAENGEFIQRRDRSGRWFSKKINPWNAADLTRLTRGQGFKFNESPFHEMALAHYRDRIAIDENRYKWLKRSFDISTAEYGLEGQGFQVDFPGWGGLAYRRVANSPGDPVEIVNGNPVYKMNILPGKIEAENYDHFVLGGEGKVYHDLSPANSGGQYRASEAVDVETCSEGGFNVTGLENGEWLSYTVAVPVSGKYKLSARYAALAAGGLIRFEFDGVDKTGTVAVPFGGEHSTGQQDWKDMTVAASFTLHAGVQNMRLYVLGAGNAFNLNAFDLSYIAALESQTIDFGVLPAKNIGAADFAPGAVASSGLAVSYSSSNPAVATIVNNQIHITGSGVTTITASQTGDDTYSPAPVVNQTLTVTGIASGDYVSSGNMNWNGGSWNIADGNGGFSSTVTTAPTAATNVHILTGHTVTLATTAGVAKNLNIQQGAALMQQIGLTVSGLSVISGEHTMSSTFTVNDLTITSSGVLASTTVPAGSVFSLITNKATAISIYGRLGAPAGSAVTAIGSGIRIFVNGSGTTTFTGNGTVNIARFSPNGGNGSSQTIIIDTDMEIRNYSGPVVASLSLQNGSVGSANKVLTINEGKTVKINGINGMGSFHGTYGPAYGLTTANNTGSSMTYNIDGTLDCTDAQFNLVTNRVSDGNVVTVNVNGTLKTGSVVRLFRYRPAQKIYVNVGDGGVVDGSLKAMNLDFATTGQSVNTSNFTGASAVATGLGGIVFNGNNPVPGTYAFEGNGGSGYSTPPSVVPTGGTLTSNSLPTYAIGNLTNGVVTSITVISTGTYTVKPTGLEFIGGGSPAQWFSIIGENQTGAVTGLAAAGVSTPFWIGNSNSSYNPLIVKPATETVFTVNVKEGNTSGAAVPNTAIALNRTWNITPAAGSATDLTFGYNNNQGNPGFVPAYDMRLLHFNTGASSWETLGTKVTPGAGIGTDASVTFNGVTSFSPFTIANDPTVLPVTLISFQATKTGEGLSAARLSWSTSMETNSDHFDVQRSTDGKTWTAIGSMKARKESAQQANYLFEDHNPLTGANLYRLKMVDLDQTFAYSFIRSLAFDSASQTIIYPNPVADKITLSTADWKDVKEINMLDASGRIVFTSGVNPSQTITTKNLGSGLYLMRVVYKNRPDEILKVVISK